MTDNEIIKALECCTVAGEYVCYESKCPLFGKGHCIRELSTDTLDLINRQKAEIERLKNLKRFEKSIDERIHTDKVRGLSWEFVTKEDRDKAFEKELEKLFDIATARAEAVKEFAERLTFEIVNKPSEFKSAQATADFLSGSSHRQIEILDIIEEIVGDKNG